MSNTTIVLNPEQLAVLKAVMRTTDEMVGITGFAAHLSYEDTPENEENLDRIFAQLSALIMTA